MTVAGFFGLFDYNKPGPGVDKGGSEKKGFVIFFEIFMRKFWKLITANLLYVLISLPVLTIGLADAGLTYLTRNYAREKHAFVSGDFFDSIKKNWKQALPIGLINLAATVIIAYDLYFFYMNSASGIGGYIMLAIMLTILIIFTFMKYYINYMMITFKLSIKQLYKNSLIFAFTGIKRNLLISLVLGLCYAFAIFLFLFVNPAISIIVIIFLYMLIFPAFRSLLIQYAVFPLIKKHMIDPYYQEHPEEGKEERRALNIEDTIVESDDEEAPLFQDTGRTDKEPEETPGRTLPKQYSEREMNHLRSLNKSKNKSDDDDGTI